MTMCAHAHVNESSVNSVKLALIAHNVKQNRLSGINVAAQVLSG